MGLGPISAGGGGGGGGGGGRGWYNLIEGHCFLLYMTRGVRSSN